MQASHVSLWSLLLSRLALQNKTSRGLCVIALLVLTRSPRRDQPTESSSQTPRASSQWQPCPGWHVRTELPGSRKTAGVTRKIFAPIIGGFATTSFQKRSAYPFLTGRSASLLARATSVWSNAVASCSARQRCRRVQSDFSSSVTQDEFHARERFVRTCVALY